MLRGRAIAAAAVLLTSGGFARAQPSAGSLTLRPGVKAGLPWFALVTGSKGGVCETRVLQGDETARVALHGYDAARRAKCESRMVTFTAGRPPSILRGVDLRRDHTVDLGKPTVKKVKAWLMDCIGFSGQRCGPGEDNLLVHDVVGDLRHATYQYGDSFLGIDILDAGVEDAAGAEAAEALRRQVDANPKLGCTDLTTSTWPFKKDSINVYYVDGLASGKACLPRTAETSKGEVAGLGFILMPASNRQDLLTHELAHILLLLGNEGHPQNRDATNVLSVNSGFARCNFSPEQAIQWMHLQDPGRVPKGLQICADDVTCQAALRLYPFSCPQEVHRTLTDWVRCLHCDVKDPPKVDVPQGTGALLHTLEMALGGFIRVPQRREIHREAAEAAVRFERPNLASQEAAALVDLHRGRALAALLRLTSSNPCEVAGAFKWALGEQSGKMPLPRKMTPSLRGDVERELERNALRLCEQRGKQ